MRLLCNDCYRFRAGEDPICARCVYERETRSERRISLASAFASLSYGGGFLLARRYDLFADYTVALIFGALVTLVIAIFIGMSGRKPNAVGIERRETDEDVDESKLDARGSPYRARVRRVVQAASPRLSGKLTVLVVGLSLVSCAVLLPVSLHLPRWVELEIVLSAWWVLLATTLAVLLYRGFRLADDWVYFAPWDRGHEVGTPTRDGIVTKEGSSRRNAANWLSGCGDMGCSGADAGEGIVFVIGLAVALAIALGAAWILVEIAMPFVFFLVYWVLMKAIGRAAKDHHECVGHLGRSALWGVVWASIYVLPLAALTFTVHRELRTGLKPETTETPAGAPR